MVPPADDLFRLTHCPACGYRLDGLPAEGVCPECGRGYDQNEIVLYGTALGQYVSVESASRGRAVVGTLISAVMAVFIGLFWVNLNRKLFPLAALFWIVSLIGFGIGLWRRWTCDMPGPIQVRFNEKGVWQSGGSTQQPAEPRWTSWNRVGRIELEARPGDRCQVRILRPFWTLSGHTVPVDAEVNCSPAQLAALRRRIEEWRSSHA